MNISKLHNRKIDIFGSEYTILIVDKIEEDNDLFAGMTYYDSNTILIAKLINKVDRGNKEMILTLLHEIIHTILLSGQYLKENENEPLIEWMARCMYSLIFNLRLFKDEVILI